MRDTPFFAQVKGHFGDWMTQYSFQVVSEKYYPESFGSAAITLRSQDLTVVFTMDGKGIEVTLDIGVHEGPMQDVGSIWRFLSRDFGDVTDFYYFTFFTMELSRPASSDWQLERLAELLRPMWPRIFQFLRAKGAQDPTYVQFKQQREERARAGFNDGYRLKAEFLSDRLPLGFDSATRLVFDFLNQDYGYEITYQTPIFVRYHRPSQDYSRPIYLNVYHRRDSYTISLDMGWEHWDPSDDWALWVFELDFNINELIQLVDLSAGPWSFVATTREAVWSGLLQLAEVCRRYCKPILEGDSRIFSQLHDQRIQAARRVTLAWTRKEAEHAFKTHDYAYVATLYRAIPDHLTETDLERLVYAEKYLAY